MPSMSSIVPHLYPNNTLLADHYLELSYPTIAAGTDGGSLAEGSIWDGDNKLVPLFDHNGALDCVVSPDSHRDMISSASMSSLSEQLGSASASDLDILAFSDYSTDLGHGISNCDQHFGGGYQPAASPLRMNCCNLVEDFDRLAYPTAAQETWGIQCNHEMKTVEEPQVKVGRYSEKERRERIHRYLKKRTQRNFNKTIKYACRKTLADRRVRVRGRFAKNSDSGDQEEFSLKNDGINPNKEYFYLADAKLRNDDEDEWLQATMANLVHLFRSFPDGTFI